MSRPIVVGADSRTALTRTGGFLLGFTHTFNPAVGCLFGRGLCGQFCYARASVAHRSRGRGAWGDYLVVKTNAAARLRAELSAAARRAADHREHLARVRVFSAATTDPCLGPLLPLYRDCLRAVADHPPGRWVIQTRSPLVTALRAEIEALRHCAIVSFTLETDDDARFGPAVAGAPSVAARRRVIEQVARWDVALHVAVSPCLPLSDAARFADWLADLGALVTVDTMVTGDGSGGARTACSPYPAFAAQLGLDWRASDHAQRLLALLRERIGDRAGWSAAGFRRLADCALR